MSSPEPRPTVKATSARYAAELRRTPGKASADGDTGWECGAGASLIVRASTPGPGKLGTHHGVIYACTEHQAAAEERIEGAGYEPQADPAPAGHRWDPWPCGHVTAYKQAALSALTESDAADDGGAHSPDADCVDPPHECPALPEQLYAVVSVGPKGTTISFDGLYEEKDAALDVASGYGSHTEAQVRGGRLDRYTFVDLPEPGSTLAVIVPLPLLPDPREADWRDEEGRAECAEHDPDYGKDLDYDDDYDDDQDGDE